VAQYAEKIFRAQKNKFAATNANSPDFNFSFSGLKTALLYKIATR